MPGGRGKRVAKAVIPAAGRGTRFLPATKAQPKEMLPLVDKPTIQYVVEEAVAAGIDDILLVTGRDKRAIEDHFDRHRELEATLAERNLGDLLTLVQDVSELAHFHYVRQPEPLGLGHAVLCARYHVGAEPFAVLLGDDVLRGERPGLVQLLEVFQRFGRPVVAVQEVPREQVSAYGVVAGREVEPGLVRVESLVEKPAPEAAPSNLAVIGRYVLTPDVFDVLERLEPGVGGEIQLTDALCALCADGPLYAVRLRGRRYDVGDRLGYLRATVELALEREDLRDAFASYLRRLVADLDR
ncbi:MAG: UTP--glucose-1-phosphate uridylyltransferase GalU [Clostridia bacterium]|nr:UTP--glucose-1-phosphate uridylyltransferase GalU [Clostridia bacterium]